MIVHDVTSKLKLFKSQNHKQAGGGGNGGEKIGMVKHYYDNISVAAIKLTGAQDRRYDPHYRQQPRYDTKGGEHAD